MDDDTLHGYLQHHWTGSTAGVALFRRVAGGQTDPATAQQVREIGKEVAEDRESLRRIMHSVGARPSTLGTAAALLGERFGRLKPNGSLLHRTPLTDLVELETLRLAVSGKRAGWAALRAVAADEPRLDDVLLAELQERNDRHLRDLEILHEQTAIRCMTDRHP